MVERVKYMRYYFPNGLRWTLLVLLIPLASYLLIISWYIIATLCLLIVFTIWTTKYVTSIDPAKEMINDTFFVATIPFGKTYRFNSLTCLHVNRENKSYKAASRSRDYWVKYTEFSLSLRYDDDKLLTLFTVNDPDQFKTQVDKFSKELNLKVQ